MTAVRAADGPARAEAALGEVQAIADSAPDAIELDPAEVRQIDAALQHQILDEPTDGVIGQRGDDRRTLPEAAP